jgi:hypothetical protein
MKGVRGKRQGAGVLVMHRVGMPQHAGSIAAQIDTGDGNILTVQLVPVSRCVRLQLAKMSGGGRMVLGPLRVTFGAERLDDVIAALENVRRIVTTAVPIIHQRR